MKKRKANWFLVLTHIGALLPLAWLALDAARRQLGFNPVREVTLRTGRYALTLLVLSLACTPIYILSGWRQAIVLRKPLGLYGALYVALHFLVFAGWDYGFQLDLIWSEFQERRFIQVGLLALLILIPLAITSSRGWIRRLGKNWRRLHRLVYLVDLLAVLPFLLLVKADRRRPLA